VPHAVTSESRYFVFVVVVIVVVVNSQDIFNVERMKRFYFIKALGAPLWPWTCNRKIFLNVRRCLFSLLSTNYLPVTAKRCCVIENNISLYVSVASQKSDAGHSVFCHWTTGGGFVRGRDVIDSSVFLIFFFSFIRSS
jgi:hypothetical protein